jgi:cation diffusion facilitator CzcD-associated flavoprotein CzcO
LHLFQRTPPWIFPKPDGPFRAGVKSLFRALPFTRWLYRAWTYWVHELRAVGFVIDPRLMKAAEKLARAYVEKEVQDPVLRAKLTPDYTIGCKRILMSNDYYEAVQQPHVEVVTDGIERVTATGIVTRDGKERPVDAIIYGTGFTASEYLAPITIVGRDGRDLNTVMQSQPETYLGITVHGFPNLFLMMGPNTGLGHNSMVFMIEAQARYALQGIQALRTRDLVSMDVHAPVQRAFNERIQAKLRKSVWNSGCQSWYLKDGHNATLWPGFTFQYWMETRALELSDYQLVARPALQPALPIVEAA